MPVDTESGLLTRARAESLFTVIAGAAAALGYRDVEAMIGAGTHALTRFANSTIHQNVAERGGYVSVRLQQDGRTARASTNRLDDGSLRAVVEEAAVITSLQPPDPDLPPMAETAEMPDVPRNFAATARLSPEVRAHSVADAITVAANAGQNAAGIYSSGESVLALLNSRGAFAYHSETMAQFSITAMARDSSGWAKASACYHDDFDPVALARSASEKAALSSDPVELPPGRYTVVLEPAAVLDLVGQMFGDFSATALRDGRSFLRDRVGTKLFGENIGIHDDVYHPLQSGAPFDGEGVRRKRLALVENGVVREIAYSRQAARMAGVEATGHGFPLPNETGEAPMNIVMGGGSVPVEEMIASTPRGILVTRFWYIREVDPYRKIMTGMTRDGTFLIEDGRIVRGVRNFRFNQSLIELLRNVEALSAPVRASGEEAFDMVVPALKAHEFNFTEVTRF
jgi:predicted Zn-dependent protease